MASSISSQQQEPDVCSISFSPNSYPGRTADLTLLSILDVPSPKRQVSFDAQPSCQNCINLQMDGEADYDTCIVDIDTEKEILMTSKPIEGNAANVKNEGIMPRVLRRQESAKLGEKFMELLMNPGSMLMNFNTRDKAVAERVHETANNRWRRYRRAASIDSRKILLLFSILSSFGTLVLIYLTLRVRQAGDGSLHN